MRLEALRGFAAAYVVLHHAQLSDRPEIRLLSSLGQEAVIVFFVLSGFVIHHASCRKGTLPRFGTYFNHRFRRIYPTFLVALGLAYVALATHTRTPVDWFQLAGNLAMLQDLGSLKRGVWVDAFAGNTALWSLSYEWWFYMLFYPLVSLRWIPLQRTRAVAFGLSIAGFLSYQAIPNQISLFVGYFFIWWAGVELSREYTSSREVTWRHQLPTILMLAGLAALWSLPVGFAAGRQPLRLGVDPVLQLRHFLAALAILVVGIAWHRSGFIGFNRVLGPFAILAPISYALYAFHLPVLHLVSAYPVHGRLARLAVGCAVLGPICYGIEVVVQRRINRWFDRLLAGPSPQDTNQAG